MDGSPTTPASEGSPSSAVASSWTSSGRPSAVAARRWRSSPPRTRHPSARRCFEPSAADRQPGSGRRVRSRGSFQRPCSPLMTSRRERPYAVLSVPRRYADSAESSRAVAEGRGLVPASWAGARSWRSRVWCSGRWPPPRSLVATCSADRLAVFLRGRERTPRRPIRAKKNGPHSRSWVTALTRHGPMRGE